MKPKKFFTALFLVAFLALATVQAGDTLTSGQVALSTTAASVATVSATRRAITVKNIDATISVYVGITGVTSSTGYLLKAGEFVRIESGAAVFAVAASGTPSVAFIAEFR